MSRRILWLVMITAVLVLPSLFLSASLQASDKLNKAKNMESDTVSSALIEYRSPGDRHKIEVTDEAVARRLEGEGGRMIGDYGNFKVFEVSEQQADDLKKREQGSYRDEYNVVMLNTGGIDTTTSEAVALQRTSGVKRGKQMHLVQFPGPIKPEWYDALLRTGVEVVSYIPSNAYLVYGNTASLRRVKRMTGEKGMLQWDGAYRDEYKIQPGDPAVTKGKDGSTIIIAGKSEETVYAIQLFKDPAQNGKTLAAIDSLKTDTIKQDYEIIHYRNIVVPIAPESLKELSAFPDVVSIERFITPTKQDERQNFIISGNLTPTPGDWLAFLAANGFTQAQFTTSNFVVNLSDSGIDSAVPATPTQFAMRLGGDITAASRIVYSRLEGTPNGGSTLQGCDGHGNLNASIVAGFVANGMLGGVNFNASPHVDASGFHFGRGVCPFVKVGSSVIFDPDTFTNPNVSNLESRAYQDGARISSNSWGNSLNSYGTLSQAYDSLVRDSQQAGSPNPTAGNQEMVIVFAAGNNGSGANTVGQPSTGKNMITVGASENVQAFGGSDGCGTPDSGANNANDIIGFSSRGPTSDQRKKPEIVAPGTHVSGTVFQQTASATGTGAAGACFDATGVCGGPAPGFDFFPLGQQFYTASSGTSHSTPAIAGIAALIRQRFINAGLTPASPALTKALIMNTARYMNGVGANDTLWSNNQGMGLADLSQFFDILLAAGTGTTATIIRDQVGADTFTASGQSRTVTGNVVDNTKPFRVTLAWTEPPGPTSGNAFVNNLDLEVTVGGQTFRGNVFTGANSSTGGTADIRNNAESVFVPAGVSGPFVVRVLATNIAGDGVPNSGGALDQDFALVVYNAQAVNQAVIAGAGSTINVEGCSPANGAVDPGETVTVSLCVQNVGTLNTTNLVGTLQATGGVIAPSGPQSYGAVTAGGAAVCRDFTFTADPSLLCGGTLTATLQLQDGATDLGTVTYNFTLGVLTTALSENFDGVTAPALPAGWTTSFTNGDGDCTVGGALCALGSNWATLNTGAVDTAPNVAFHNDPSCVTDNVLVSPPINITTTSAQLIFRNNFNVENTFDGGVLEVSSPNINGGAFTDVTDAAVGGSFVTGGYTAIINSGATNFLSPLRGRMAWTGNSNGFITTTVNLGPNVVGQTIQIRFRFASDCSVSGTGWRIDTIQLTDGFECCEAAGQSCTLTIECPTAVTGTTSSTGGTTGVVSYPAPIIGGDCVGATATCIPPSGSTFPAGVTTVVCTATHPDAIAPAMCSFTVSVFDVCLQDDSNPSTVLLFNTTTKEFRFCCPAAGPTPISGTGTVSRKGNTISINANVPGYKVSATVTLNKGEAALKAGSSTICTIRDSNMTNNTCSCGAAPPMMAGRR